MSCKLIILDEVNIKVTGLKIETRRKIANKLKYVLPYARHMPAFKLGRWDGTKTFFSIGGSGYLAHLDVILPVIESDGYEIEVEDRRETYELDFTPIDENYWADKGVVWPEGHELAGQPIILRDYQYDVVNKFLENPQSLQEVSTGAGKTITTATLSHLCEHLGRTIVVVPNKSLVSQTEEDYITCGLDVGVYFGDRKELGKTHTICTWQSLNILDKKTKNSEVLDEALTLAEFAEGVNAIIVDECHSIKADVLSRLLTNNFKNCVIRWGVTGTIPKEQWEYQSLLSSIGPVINRVSAKELQDKNVLANLQINVLQTVDIEEFKTYQDENTFLVTSDKRLEWMAGKIKEFASDGNTLVLINRIKTGDKLLELLEDSDTVFIKGAVKVSDRKDEYNEIKTAQNKVIIATYGVAAVGINIPRIFNLVLVEPGKSFVRVIQSIGRGIRRAEDKDYVNVYDITSTCKFAKRHLTSRKKFYRDAEYPFKITKIKY